MYVLFYFSQYMQLSETFTQNTLVHISNTVIRVEVAHTQQKREQGLSGRPSLAQGRGMLFVFDRQDAWGIWMKGMQFPLDIIWTNATGTIITIAHNVSPDTYPTIFYPAQATALYVLEVPAGFAKKQGIVEGTKIQL